MVFRLPDDGPARIRPLASAGRFELCEPADMGKAGCLWFAISDGARQGVDAGARYSDASGREKLRRPRLAGPAQAEGDALADL